MGDHVTEALAEEYVLGRVVEAELARVEEHLVICQECRRRVAEALACVRAIRAALDTHRRNGR